MQLKDLSTYVPNFSIYVNLVQAKSELINILENGKIRLFHMSSQQDIQLD